MMKCSICGNPMKLYKKENFNFDELDSYAFSSRKIPEYMHYALYECKHCHILYSHCPIEVREIFERYKNADFDSGIEADDASKTYFKYLKKFLPDFPKSSALDIGTGNGSYLKILKTEGVNEIVGVEPSIAPIENADGSIRSYIVNDVFKRGLFSKNKFDMVSLFQTIEHIPDTEDMLDIVYEILKENGYFYLVCHNYRSIVNKIFRTRSPIYDIEHLQIFSKKSIYRILEKKGFKNIHVFTLWNIYPVKYWIRLFPFTPNIKKVILKMLSTSMIGQIRIAINVGNIGVIASK